MVIKDERNLVPTKFENLKIGDVYKIRGQGETLMKIAHVYLETDDDMNIWNCVCLDDGCLDCTHDGTDVVKLKAELHILN